jgi:hypothetical protein
VTPGRVLGALLLGDSLLILAGITVEVLRLGFGYEHLMGLFPRFHLDLEGNIPSYYSALQLLAAAVMLAVIAMLAFCERSFWRWHWTVLGAGFLFMSFDEMTSIHELLIAPLQPLTIGNSWLFYAWVVPALIALPVFLLTYLPFLLTLPRHFTLLFLLSAVIFLGGSVGLEMIGGHIIALHGKINAAAYQTEVVVEEGMEMIGISLFIYTLVRYLAETGISIRLTFQSAPSGRATGEYTMLMPLDIVADREEITSDPQLEKR